METVKSLLNLLQLQCSQTVVISRAGAFYKARFAGRSEFVFGDTPEEAVRRLLRVPLGSNRFNKRPYKEKH